MSSEMCWYYAGCKNLANGYMKVDLLGRVPTCWRCAMKHDLSFDAELERKVLTPATVDVGDGVTEQVGSDRYAGTVVGRSPSGKTIYWQRDHARAAEPVMGTYKYTYEPDSTGSIHTARWNAKRQRYLNVGAPLMSGRHQWSDPSF